MSSIKDRDWKPGDVTIKLPLGKENDPELLKLKAKIEGNKQEDKNEQSKQEKR